MKKAIIISIFVTINSIVTNLSISEKVDILNKTVSEDESELKASYICPLGMAYVHGLMLEGDSDYIEALQNNTCTDWISNVFPARCKTFNQDAWRKVVKKLPKKEMQFCIDLYEFPNQIGTKPKVNINWDDAIKTCQSLGKRLCNEDEWSFACEGEEALPYPYGYVRDSNSCNIDKPWIEPDYNKVNDPNEISRLWQGVNSGEMKKCVSPFGVHDMTGNVDEWTISNRKTGYPSILKGGYWSVVRNRCRPSTRNHNQWHHWYQQGFRCCSNINTK